MKKLLFVIVLAMLLTSLSAFAAPPTPITATVETMSVSPFPDIGFAATVHFVRLSWTNSVSSAVTQNDVYRGLAPNGVCGTLAQIGVSPVSTPSYDDSTAVQGTNYCYVVRAFNGVDESPDSNVAQATIPFPPQAPTGLGATPK